MKKEDFVNKLIDLGWVMTEMKGNFIFMKRSKNDAFPYVKINTKPESKDVEALITVVHDETCVNAPLIDKKPVSDFLLEKDGNITCSRIVRKSFLQKNI